MAKLKINKKLVAGLLAGTIVITSAGYIAKKQHDDKYGKPTITNSIGHTDINPYINFNLDEEDFVVLDMGDHDTVKTHFDERKARYCNEHDVTLGVIISSDASDEASIYDDVEYTKNLIRKYNVNFPVYLDINNIITNDDLNIEMKTKLIKDFVEKCSANNMYVGLYGTDTNLTRVKQYCEIADYDAFLVMDSDEIKYDGPYYVYQDLEGNVRSEEDLGKIIGSKGLNDPNHLVSDSTYQLAAGEDITDVSLKYGMSVNELLEFNGLKKSDIKEGVYIKIPSVVSNVVSSDLKIEYPELEEPIRGCDISYAQGNNMDWNLMKENFDFVIVRCANGLNKDITFENNALNANQNNIPLGVYCYNGFTKKNCQGSAEFVNNQLQQAEHTLELLKNKKIDYPVYLDIEGKLEETLDEESVRIMLEVWAEKISSAGYNPGIYCNQSGFKFLQSKVDYDITERFQVWIAGGEQYTGETTDIALDDVVPSASVKEKNPGAKIIQATDSAIGGGAGNSQGHLDINYSYCDYSNGKVVGKETPTDQEKEFNRHDYPLIAGTTSASVGLALLAGAGFKLMNNKKKRKKSKVKVKTPNETK